MTENYCKASKKAEKKRRCAVTDIVMPLLGTALMAMFLINSGVASEAVLAALGTGIRSVIPSIFPCMVLSKFVVALHGDQIFSKLFGRPVELAFGISRSAATPIVIGALCGFPLGAVMASELYLSGELTRNELERIIGFISLPSPTFVINAVGIGMLGDVRIGILLYIVLLAVSLLIGIIVCRIRRDRSDGEAVARKDHKDISISDAVVDAIGGSAIASLKLCAYIAFFSAMTAVLGRVLDISPIISVLIGGAFEFSSGCFAATRLGTSLTLPLCALILGWSGFAVHFQVMSVCPKGISYKYFYITLVLRAALCFFTVWFVK